MKVSCDGVLVAGLWWLAGMTSWSGFVVPHENHDVHSNSHEDS